MKQSIFLFLLSANIVHAAQDEKTHLELFKRRQLSTRYDSTREPLHQSSPAALPPTTPTSPTSLSSPGPSTYLTSPSPDGRNILREKTPPPVTIIDMDALPSSDHDAEAAKIKALALQKNPHLFEEVNTESKPTHAAQPTHVPLPLAPESPRTPRRNFIINPDLSILSPTPSPQRIILPHLSPNNNRNNAILIMGAHARKKTKTPPLPLETNSSPIPTGFTSEQQKSPRKTQSSTFSDAITTPPETQKKQLPAASMTKSSESDSTPQETATNGCCPCCFCCSWFL